ncbi:fructose-specific PTS transporter subunit EIIC [Dactylosporangium darangshiense]|uniref:Fructose-specific PTS transporter subunit EIIC n=1 Tax=Dactylosporangium darangshiense TaxID=579108 RepID=A0ABP8CXQ6_9ACTN
MKIVAVTSCPAGIAHTFMAAEALEQAAHAAGHEIIVETQSAGTVTPLSPEQITAADAVVFAADVEVRDRARFDGKPQVIAPVKRAIIHAPSLIQEAAAAAKRSSAAAGQSAAPLKKKIAGPSTKKQAGRSPAAAGPIAALSTKVDRSAPLATRIRQWLMTGVSYMIPFVAAGGILIASSFLIGGPSIASKVSGGTFEGVTYPGVADPSKLWATLGLAGVLFEIGSVAFSMLVPILAGFIAFGMVDRPGIVPGVVGGLLATSIGAGFLGGLIAGLLAGTVVMAINRIKAPRAVAGVMSVVVVPLLSSAIVGSLMIIAIGQPISAVQKGLSAWLTALSGANAILLGLLLGAMMAFDMGGPVNKVAYTFGLAGLASGNHTVMAAVMAAGMTPPLALALATVLRPKLFTDAERRAGEAAWLLGASFITEGAIPFAAADPLRVIPSIMAGSAVTGALSMAFHATSWAPHGGIWVIGLIGRPVLYVLAIAVGAVISAICIMVLKARHAAVRRVPDSPQGEMERAGRA